MSDKSDRYVYMSDRSADDRGNMEQEVSKGPGGDRVHSRRQADDRGKGSSRKIDGENQENSGNFLQNSNKNFDDREKTGQKQFYEASRRANYHFKKNTTRGNGWLESEEMVNGYETFGERRDRKKIAIKNGQPFKDGDEYTVLLKKTVKNLKNEKLDLQRKCSITEIDNAVLKDDKIELQRKCSIIEVDNTNLKDKCETLEGNQKTFDSKRIMGLAHYQIAVAGKISKAFKISMDNIERFVSEQNNAVLQVCESAANVQWKNDELTFPETLWEEVLAMNKTTFNKFRRITSEWDDPDSYIEDLPSWSSVEANRRRKRRRTEEEQQGSSTSKNSKNAIVQSSSTLKSVESRRSDDDQQGSSTSKNSKNAISQSSSTLKSVESRGQSSSTSEGNVDIFLADLQTFENGGVVDDKILEGQVLADYQTLERERGLEKKKKRGLQNTEKTKNFDGIVTKGFYNQGTVLGHDDHEQGLMLHDSDGE